MAAIIFRVRRRHEHPTLSQYVKKSILKMMLEFADTHKKRLFQWQFMYFKLSQLITCSRWQGATVYTSLPVWNDFEAFHILALTSTVSFWKDSSFLIRRNRKFWLSALLSCVIQCFGLSNRLNIMVSLFRVHSFSGTVSAGVAGEISPQRPNRWPVSVPDSSCACSFAIETWQTKFRVSP